MKYLFAIALLLGSLSSVRADVFQYACKVGAKSYPLRIDDGRKSFQWRGATYKIRDLTEAEQRECTKFCYGVEGHGKSFVFDTATKGMADFGLDGQNVSCQLK